MSAYSIVNLKEEVEDSMGERAPGIEGRFARKHLDSEHLGISYLRYSPGVRSPSAHSHREQEEAYVVISGSGQVRLDDEIRELRCWDVVRVNPATVRAFEAGDDGLELIAIGSDRPEGGDDPNTGRMISDDIAEQTEQTFRNMEVLLEAAGASLDDVVSCLVHVTDLSHYATFNAIYETKFTGTKPVRTTVRADLVAGMLVEITAVARASR